MRYLFLLLSGLLLAACEPAVPVKERPIIPAQSSRHPVAPAPLVAAETPATRKARAAATRRFVWHDTLVVEFSRPWGLVKPFGALGTAWQQLRVQVRGHTVFADSVQAGEGGLFTYEEHSPDMSDRWFSFMSSFVESFSAADKGNWDPNTVEDFDGANVNRRVSGIDLNVYSYARFYTEDLYEPSPREGLPVSTLSEIILRGLAQLRHGRQLPLTRLKRYLEIYQKVRADEQQNSYNELFRRLFTAALKQPLPTELRRQLRLKIRQLS